jgi:hypothetical protein
MKKNVFISDTLCAKVKLSMVLNYAPSHAEVREIDV